MTVGRSLTFTWENGRVAFLELFSILLCNGSSLSASSSRWSEVRCGCGGDHRCCGLLSLLRFLIKAPSSCLACVEATTAPSCDKSISHTTIRVWHLYKQLVSPLRLQAVLYSHSDEFMCHLGCYTLSFVTHYICNCGYLHFSMPGTLSLINEAKIGNLGRWRHIHFSLFTSFAYGALEIAGKSSCLSQKMFLLAAESTEFLEFGHKS